MYTDTVLDPSVWWRTLCFVTDQLVVTGDLHARRDLAEKQLDDWSAVGVSHIVDVREEWNDAAFVNDRHPEITYLHRPTHDNGGRQDDEWFTSGVSAIVDAISADSNNIVVVHCHMGVNRAPSLAFAALLEMGWTVEKALNSIRKARQIVGILYAEQAVDWFARRHHICSSEHVELRRSVRQWLAANSVDSRWVISRIRLAENDPSPGHRKAGIDAPGNFPQSQTQLRMMTQEVL